MNYRKAVTQARLAIDEVPTSIGVYNRTSEEAEMARLHFGDLVNDRINPEEYCVRMARLNFGHRREVETKA